MRDFLGSVVGYARLEDTVNSEEFYLASYRAEFLPTATREVDRGGVVIEFERKPQRFLKSGEVTTEWIPVYGKIVNPTNMTAKPLIWIEGNYPLTINGCTITPSENQSGRIYVDSESHEIYRLLLDGDDVWGMTEEEIQVAVHDGGVLTATDAHSLIEFSNGDFPVLDGGENAITGLSSLGIKPRWWRL